jgi:hypothetical protein
MNRARSCSRSPARGHRPLAIRIAEFLEVAGEAGVAQLVADIRAATDVQRAAIGVRRGLVGALRRQRSPPQRLSKLEDGSTGWAPVIRLALLAGLAAGAFVAGRLGGSGASVTFCCDSVLGGCGRLAPVTGAVIDAVTPVLAGAEAGAGFAGLAAAV